MSSTLLRRSAIIFLVFVTTWMIGSPLAVSHEDPSCDRPLGDFPFDWVGSVEIAGPYAYLLSGTVLRIIDISDPTLPKFLGSVIGAGRGSRNKLIVSGSYAYTLASRSGTQHSRLLSVIDISSPSHPVVVGSTNTTTSGRLLAIDGTTAYVASGTGEMETFDISAPSSPLSTGVFTANHDVNSFAVVEGHAFLAGTKLSIVDVSAPSSAVLVSTTAPGWKNPKIAVVNDYLYAATWNQGLRIIDVSVPSNPIEVGFFNTHWRVFSLAVLGNHACLIEPTLDNNWDKNLLRLLDVSVPSRPIEISSLEIPEEIAEGVTLQEDHAFIFGSIGLQLIDITSPELPIYSGFFGNPLIGYDVALSGKFAYVATGDAGLRVLDISDPSVIREVGFFDTAGQATLVEIKGNLAYVADSTIGLLVLDISTPISLIEVGRIDLVLRPKDMALAGNLAVITTSSKVQVIDISLPTRPVLVGSVRVGGLPEDIVVDGDYAFVGAKGLSIVDISDPSIPVEAGFFPTGEITVGVAVNDGFAYLNGRSLRIFDVSDPTSPVQVGIDPCPWEDCPYPNRLAISGTYLYRTQNQYPAGFETSVLDVSDPYSLDNLHGMSGIGYRFVKVSGRYTFLFGGGGISVYPRCFDFEIRQDGVDSGPDSIF